MLLVRGASEHALARGWRWFAAQGQRPRVALRPEEVLAAPPGSLVLFRARPDHAPVLQEFRPLFRDRRVVLWLPPGDDLALLARAPDFVDWASASADCPWIDLDFAVRGLAAARAQRGLVHWDGPGAPPSAEEIPVERGWRELNNRARRTRGGEARVRVEPDLFFLRRARLALAGARRARTRLLWSEGAEVPGWWTVHGRVLSLAEAAARIGAELAAQSGLEPEVVALIEALRAEGVGDAEIEAALLEDGDPGVGLARMAAARWGLDVGALGGRFGPSGAGIPGLREAGGPTPLAHRVWGGTEEARGAGKAFLRATRRAMRGSTPLSRQVLAEFAAVAPPIRDLNWASRAAIITPAGAELAEWIQRSVPADRQGLAFFRAALGGDLAGVRRSAAAPVANATPSAQGLLGNLQLIVAANTSDVLRKFVARAVTTDTAEALDLLRAELMDHVVRAAGTQHGLGMLLLQTARFFDRAPLPTELPALQAAAEEFLLVCEDSDAWDASQLQMRLATGFFALRQWSEAVEWFDRADDNPHVTLLPDTLEQYAIALAALGRHADAARIFLDALDQTEDADVRERISAGLTSTLALGELMPASLRANALTQCAPRASQAFNEIIAAPHLPRAHLDVLKQLQAGMEGLTARLQAMGLPSSKSKQN